MAITVQQFDFLAETKGINTALRRAEEAGGVTGTRDQPTQVQVAPQGTPFAGGSTARLSGPGGEFMPGTLQTGTSRGIGAAGTAASGQTMGREGGGGLAAGVTSPGGRSLAEIMGMFQGDTSAIPGYLPNAPTTAATPAPTDPAQLALDRALAGEILATAEIAALDRDRQIEIVDQVLGNLVGELARFADAGDGSGVTSVYGQILNLWQNFYEPGGGRPGQADIVPLMNKIAGQRGFGENYFAGLERALETGGTEFTLGGTAKVPGAAPQQGLIDFISSYASQTNDWTKALNAAANYALANQDNDQYKAWASQNDIPEFSDFREAYAHFQSFWSMEQEAAAASGTGWIIDALGSEERLGDLGRGDNAGAFAAGGDTAATAATTATTWTPGAEGGPGGPVPSAVAIGDLGAHGVGAETRGFGDVFPGFLSTSPYVGIPNVGSAIAAAAPYLQSQYQMVSPMMTDPVPEGRSRAGEWLRGLSTGTTNLLRGNPLAQRLQEISAGLQGPMAGSVIDGVAQPNVFRQQFYDPKNPASARQVSAFQNPFVLATRGAPDARSAVLNAIQKAATDFAYKYPSGIPIEGGGDPEQFLPWALRTNLMGIQQLPEFQGVNWG